MNREQREAAVDWFADRMKRKLRENEHKGGWDKDGNFALLERLNEETQELDDAICLTEDAGIDERFMEAVIDEAADVANFAMMIAEKAKARLERRR